MKKSLVVLTLLAGCSSTIMNVNKSDSVANGIPVWNKSNILVTFTDRINGIRKELVDLDGDKKYDLVATYFICDGKINERPSSIYDIRTNILYLDKPLIMTSAGGNVVAMDKDDRCK